MPPPWSCRNPARLRREEIPRLLVRFHFPIKFALDLMSMPFVVIIPARLASTRLPNKPLADLGGKPMIVRVAERAAHSGADRIAEVASALGLPGNAVVVNVQGDEPLLDPELVAATAALVSEEVPMATAAHPIDDMQEILNPNVVKVVLNNAGRAMYFSRAPIPWHRDGFAQSMEAFPAGYAPLRHIGLYAYTNSFLQRYPGLPIAPIERVEALEQLRALWHHYPIAVHVTSKTPEAGVDTAEA